jgi:hypothetical protein
MENKRWCKIEGYDNYSVSDYGNVRNDQTGRILKGALDNGRYYNVRLYLNGKVTICRIHRLVATYFCKNENNYNEIDHIDCNKINNHYTNLRWTTSRQNIRNILKRDGALSKYLGVSYDKQNQKWKAQIRINKKQKHIGNFDTEEEAYQAFRDAVAEHNLSEFYPPENNLI